VSSTHQVAEGKATPLATRGGSGWESRLRGSGWRSRRQLSLRKRTTTDGARGVLGRLLDAADAARMQPARVKSIRARNWTAHTAYRQLHARVQGEGPSEPPEGGAEAAAELVADALKASSEKNLPALLLLAPDSFGDDGDERRAAKQPLGFYVDRQMAEFESLVAVDSFVRRCLLFGSPASSQVGGGGQKPPNPKPTASTHTTCHARPSSQAVVCSF